jgi:hypothetical protein
MKIKDKKRRAVVCRATSIVVLCTCGLLEARRAAKKKVREKAAALKTMTDEYDRGRAVRFLLGDRAVERPLFRAFIERGENATDVLQRLSLQFAEHREETLARERARISEDADADADEGCLCGEINARHCPIHNEAPDDA